MANILCFCLFLTLVYVSDGTLQLYNMPNYKGEFFQIRDIQFGLHDIPDFAVVKSLRTSECVVLIEYTGSVDDMNVAIQAPGIPDLEAIDSPITPNKFAMCDDFYGPKYKKRGIIATFNEQNVSLAEMHGCFTFPTSRGVISRIYNLGNCVTLFEKANCMGGRLSLRGGVSKNSLNPPPYKSLSHCMTCPICSLLNATLLEVSLHEQSNETRLMNKTVDFGSSMIFLNAATGGALVTDKYSTKSSGIREKIEIVRAQYLMNMNDVKLSPFFQYFSTRNYSHISDLIKTTLEDAYKKPVKNDNNPMFVKEKVRSYSVTQFIKMTHCQNHFARTFVRILENYPINFELYFEIREAIEPPILTKGRISDVLNEMFENDPSIEIFGDLDKDKLVIKFNGKLFATFGQEQFVESTGSYLHYHICHGVKQLNPLYDDLKHN